MLEVFLFLGDEVRGPFLPDELSALWKEGDIPLDALFWFDGMPVWRAIEHFAKQSASPAIVPANVILTTTHQVANRSVLVERQVITSECVLGVNVFKDLLAGLTDVTGGRSQTLQQALRGARVACMNELQVQAAECNADAVIGINLAYSEISGQGKSMLLVVASGTAVKLKPQPPAPPRQNPGAG